MTDFLPSIPENKKTVLGRTEVSYKEASSILTKGKGFMSDYDYTLNPYTGCSFGCIYCYAAFFTRSLVQRDRWGYWLQVKQNAVELLAKFRRKPLHGKTIYMSSVTDPYQPIEKDLKLTRSLLKELLAYHQPRLVIQTRSPLVVRDIDLFKQFSTIQVNMTITTDSEIVRKVFEPLCPSNDNRLEAIKKIHEAGVNTCITMTPLLPIENPEAFAGKLLNTGVGKFIIQPFHSDKGKFIAGTRQSAVDVLKKMDWTQEKHLKMYEVIKKIIPQLSIGKEGFKPL